MNLCALFLAVLQSAKRNVNFTPCCHVNRLSTPGFLRNVVVQDGTSGKDTLVLCIFLPVYAYYNHSMGRQTKWLSLCCVCAVLSMCVFAVYQAFAIFMLSGPLKIDWLIDLNGCCDLSFSQGLGRKQSWFLPLIGLSLGGGITSGLSNPCNSIPSFLVLDFREAAAATQPTGEWEGTAIFISSQNW